MKIRINKATLEKKDIVALLDIDELTATDGGRAFLRKAEKEGRVDPYPFMNIPISLLVYKKEKETRISFSGYKTRILMNRLLHPERDWE